MAGKYKYRIVKSETAGGFVEALSECGEDGFESFTLADRQNPFGRS